MPSVEKRETNHFRDIVIKPNAPGKEELKTWELTGETYVALHTKCSRRDLGTWEDDGKKGDDPTRKAGGVELVDERDVVFVPYYMRANSGGKGHMRVGMIKG